MAPRVSICSANFTYIPVKTTAQIPMLSAHLAINLEIQGLNFAADIFSFFHGQRQSHLIVVVKLIFI